MRDYIDGLTGRISVPVGPETPGEIMLELDDGVQAYTAYSAGGEELKKNSHAVVMQQTGPHTVLVTAVEA